MNCVLKMDPAFSFNQYWYLMVPDHWQQLALILIFLELFDKHTMFVLESIHYNFEK